MPKTTRFRRLKRRFLDGVRFQEFWSPQIAGKFNFEPHFSTCILDVQTASWTTKRAGLTVRKALCTSKRAGLTVQKASARPGGQGFFGANFGFALGRPEGLLDVQGDANFGFN